MASTVVIFSMCLLNMAAGAGVGLIHIEVPDECKGKDFCSATPKNFEEIEKRIEELLPKPLLSAVEKRVGGPIEEVSPESDWHNCPTRKTEATPYFVSAPGGKFHVIAQTRSFRQTIKMVECANDLIPAGNDQCFQDMALNKFSLNSRCEQIRATRILYIYNQLKDIIEMRPYEVPVCCSCRLSLS